MSETQSKRNKELTIEFLKKRSRERQIKATELKNEMEAEMEKVRQRFAEKIEIASTLAMQDVIKLEKLTGESYLTFIIED